MSPPLATSFAGFVIAIRYGTAVFCALFLELLGDRRLPAGNGQHDPDADGDQGADADPDRRDPTEHTGLVQGEADAEDHDEVPDQKKMNEPHTASLVVVQDHDVPMTRKMWTKQW